MRWGRVDQVTGWGSANMLQLAWTFNWFIATDFGAPVTQFGGPPINRWYNSDQTVYFDVNDTSANGAPPIGVAGFTMIGMEILVTPIGAHCRRR